MLLSIKLLSVAVLLSQSHKGFLHRPCKSPTPTAGHMKQNHFLAQGTSNL